MNTQQKNEIASLRREGYGYTRIAQALGLSKNTVKSYCKRNNLSGEAFKNLRDTRNTLSSFCLECGKEVKQTADRKKKKFCSDECRRKWWNARPERIKRKAIYTFTCAGCGKEFTAYGNSTRKYCSHSCYISDRFKGDESNA